MSLSGNGPYHLAALTAALLFHTTGVAAGIGSHLRCRGFDGMAYTMEVVQGQVYSILSARDHQLSAKFEDKAQMGFIDLASTFFGDQKSTKVVISELGLLYHNAQDDANATNNHTRVHLKALSNGTLETSVNHLKYDGSPIKEGSLAVAPCPLRELEALRLPSNESVLTLTTPLLSLYIWGMAAPDSSADHGALRMRAAVDFKRCQESGPHINGILGSTIDSFLAEMEDGPAAGPQAAIGGGHHFSHSGSPGLNQPVSEDDKKPGEVEHELDAASYMLPGLFTEPHAAQPQAVQSHRRRLHNLRGWLQARHHNPVPPRRALGTHRSLHSHRQKEANIKTGDSQTWPPQGGAQRQIYTGQPSATPRRALPAATVPSPASAENAHRNPMITDVNWNPSSRGTVESRQEDSFAVPQLVFSEEHFSNREAQLPHLSGQKPGSLGQLAGLPEQLPCGSLELPTLGRPDPSSLPQLPLLRGGLKSSRQSSSLQEDFSQMSKPSATEAGSYESDSMPQLPPHEEGTLFRVESSANTFPSILQQTQRGSDSVGSSSPSRSSSERRSSGLSPLSPVQSEGFDSISANFVSSFGREDEEVEDQLSFTNLPELQMVNENLEGSRKHAEFVSEGADAEGSDLDSSSYGQLFGQIFDPFD